MAKLDLAALAAKQKEKESAPATPAEAPKPAGLGFLKKATTAAPAEPEPEKPAAPATGGLGFLKNKIGSTPAPAAAAPTPSPSPAPTPPADDLSALLDSEVGGGSKPTTTPSGFKSRFADEEPATAPDRALPEDAEKPMRQFVESLDSVYKIVHEPDLLGGVIKSIMIELAQKPEYRKLIQPKDIHTMIKGMRDSMGMARIKKEESKAKRSGGSRSKKPTKVDDLDVLAALDELGSFD